MNNDNLNNESSNILLSFIVGAAAGLAAGMLLTPDSGVANRKFIAQKANDLSKKANDLSGQLGSQLNNTIGKITKKKSSTTASNTETGTSTAAAVTTPSTPTASSTTGTGKKPKKTT